MENAISYFHSWTQHDFDKAAAFLADDIAFDMPINSYSSKEAFVQALKFTASMTSEVRMLDQFSNTTAVVLIYDMLLSQIGQLRVAEQLVFDNQKIVFIRHIHDTEALLKAGFKKT